MEAINALGRIRGSAIALASATVFGVLLLGVLDGVLIGVVLSMLALVWRLNNPDLVVVAEQGGDRLVVRVLGPLYFANIGLARSRLLKLADSDAHRPRMLVLDLVGVLDADVTTLLELPELERDLRDRGVELQFENIAPRVRELARRTPGLADRFV